MKGKKHSLETRRAIGSYHLGERNVNWKGGVAKFNKHVYRKTFEWRVWLEACMKRDDYSCRVCLKKGVRLEVHHIKTWSAHPELRFETANGITLCHSCHRLTFQKENLSENFFRKVLVSSKRDRSKQLSIICSPKRG